MSRKKCILVILDGWGHGPDPAVSAIAQANTSFVDSLYDKYPHTELVTHGEAVGLPKGQMGNSEVGHMNIGAGRVVYQELLRINKAVADSSLAQNDVLQEALQYCRDRKKPLHLMGLVSDGGVHSSIEHIKALCTIASKAGVTLYVHAFTDGRDTDPKSGKGFIGELQQHLQASGGKLASVVGRYYAMDRDKRWERIRKAYDLLVRGKGTAATDPVAAIQQAYEAGTTDEFIEPVVLTGEGQRPVATIGKGDAVLCANFRTDRCRQLTEALTQKPFPECQMKPLPLHYVTMTEYDKTFQNVRVMLRPNKPEKTLGEVLSQAGRSQIRIAETEKYPHVTYFFSGGREDVFEGEDRILIPSPKVATYDLQPEMSAPEVTEAILPKIKAADTDFICLNYANPDMVGHTGVFEAAVKAVETVDRCTRRLVEAAQKTGYSLIVTADHGNADYMVNPDGSPNTAHTKNPVPCFLLDNTHQKIREGKLGDLAPTILRLMEMDIPEEMTGEVLV